MAADWRERYLRLADQTEKDELARIEAERDISRLITRLCVAVSGLDPALDPHLERLRQAARGGRTEAVLRQAGDLTDSLAQAAEGRTRPGPLALLLERGGLGRRQIDAALRLWAEVAADPPRASDTQLDNLTGLLQAGLRAAAGQPPGSGLLSRLIGRRPGEPDSQPNRLLLDVLQVVEWPDGLLPEVDTCRGALTAEAAPDAWVGVVRRIGDLVVEAMEQAQDSARIAEAFLTRLNQRLEELDRHLLDEVERREASLQSGQHLGQNMNREALSLSASVRDSVDLAELQSSVLGSLDRMHSHVRLHLDGENSRREKAEAEAEQLRDRLRQMEQDTFELRRQVAETREKAMRDPLTGLPNRAAYDERMAQEFARWKRFGNPLAVLVWDVDDFKAVNDTFGHKAGDKALVMIGRILRDRLRETDFIARYGGEELVVVLTGAPLEDALRIAEQMRAAVEDGGLHAHGKPVRLTVSGGLAMFAGEDTPGDVFERADKALYKAKHRGKNCVVAA